MNDSNNFKLLNKIEFCNNNIFSFIDSIPHKEIVVRDRIRDACFDLIMYCNQYNLNRDKSIKINYLIKLLGVISMLNYYMNYLYDRHYISKKIFNNISYLLREERKMTYGLIEYNKV